MPTTILSCLHSRCVLPMCAVVGSCRIAGTLCVASVEFSSVGWSLPELVGDWVRVSLHMYAPRGVQPNMVKGGPRAASYKRGGGRSMWTNVCRVQRPPHITLTTRFKEVLKRWDCSVITSQTSFLTLCRDAAATGAHEPVCFLFTKQTLTSALTPWQALRRSPKVEFLSGPLSDPRKESRHPLPPAPPESWAPFLD
jgi:hypothetical protein